jgi:hypothetical protein
MAGRRRKPCEFCGDDWFQQEDGKNRMLLSVEVYPFNNFIGITAQANDEIGELQEISMQIPMDYCPACGRKLDY